MTIDWQVVATIAAPIIALFVGAWIEQYVRKKPKIVAYVGHVADFRLRRDEGITPIYTHSLVIRSTGREAATNVRVGHYSMPPDYHIFPAIQHEVRDVPDTGQEILIPTLIPEEQITISYLYFTPVTTDRIHSYLKHDHGFAKVISVIMQQQFAPWVGKAVLAFAVVGIVALPYALFVIFW